MMEDDPFHKGGSSNDHGGSGYSSEIAKKFGPQLPDFKGYSDGSGTSLKVIAESLTPMAESFGPYGVMALDILDLGIMTYDLLGGVCFTEDTPIYIKDGHKLIKDIKVGDHVYSENPETGEKGLKKVTRKFIKETKALVHIYVGNIEIKATPTHPFWVIGKGWVEAGKLAAGNKLLLYSGKEAKITVIKYEKFFKSIKVYNFEVEDWHTYFVSRFNILVHNFCNLIAIDPKRLNHIFRDADGHFMYDTPKNRKAIVDTANNKYCYLGPDKYGNQWYARTTSDGSQIWAEVRGGQIINGGINQSPKTYNSASGLCYPGE